MDGRAKCGGACSKILEVSEQIVDVNVPQVDVHEALQSHFHAISHELQEKSFDVGT